MIAILEDDPARTEALTDAIRKLLPTARITEFHNARNMTAWLAEHLGEIDLISLDHDLPIQRDENNQLIDCGSGREGTDYLATLPPTCPVIVHSSNVTCADAMTIVLCEAGWPCRRVLPRDDLAWIHDEWAGAVRDYIHGGWIPVPERSGE